MKESSLRHHLREYYGAKRLSPSTRDRLLVLLEGLPAVGRPGRMAPTWRLLAAAGALAAFTLLLFLVIRNSGRPAGALAEAVAREIAMNHNKQLAVEFSAGSYAELGDLMDKLDFRLVEPGRVPGSGLRVLGGRYCSIQGRLAAQIRLVDDQGGLYTLYQTPSIEELARLPEREVTVDRVRVKIWRQSGLVFGLADHAN